MSTVSFTRPRIAQNMVLWACLRRDSLRLAESRALLNCDSPSEHPSLSQLLIQPPPWLQISALILGGSGLESPNDLSDELLNEVHMGSKGTAGLANRTDDLSLILGTHKIENWPLPSPWALHTQATAYMHPHRDINKHKEIRRSPSHKQV